MNSPKLLEETLQLKLQLDMCEPPKVAEIQAAINSKIDAICLISKVSKERVEAVISRRYPDYISERHKAGNIKPFSTEIKFPLPPPIPNN